MSTPIDQGSPVSGAFNIFDLNRVRLSQAQGLHELKDDLLRASYQPGAVHLDSGVEQPYFFDKYLIVSRPSILRRLSRYLAERVPAETDRIAAPTLGALAIGTAVALETGLPLAIVRTEWDEKQKGRPVEGGLHQGETVVLIEDVVVTGSRALGAVERLRNAGARVTAVLAAVDCERGADRRLADADLLYEPLFRYSAFSSTWETQ